MRGLLLRIPRPRAFDTFYRTEVLGGVLLLAAAVAALFWANSPWAASYSALWSRSVSVGLAGWGLTKPLGLWVNDGLMAVFFLLVGLEIKREFLAGEMSSARKAALPLAAAVGGMVVPALLYLAVNHSGPGRSGWGVPMATDIAFALGLLAILGRGAPLALKVFLAAVAIVDDLGAILVIAVAYTADVSGTALLAAGLAFAGLFALNRIGVRVAWPYVAIGTLLWYALVKSGVHATLAGVLLAFSIPMGAAREEAAEEEGLLRRLEHGLHPWVAFGIVPLFALANAGVSLGAGSLGRLIEPVGLGVFLGLVVGKQIGVLGFAWLAVRAGLAELPDRVTWRHLHGVAALCGIGFTMSLFIGYLAFVDAAVLEQAKTAILAASVVCAVLAHALFTSASRVPAAGTGTGPALPIDRGEEEEVGVAAGDRRDEAA